MTDDLVRAIKDRTALLFVGAGVSMNLGLPSFHQLTAHLAADLEWDPDLFHSQGDYLALAEYYLLCKGSIGPLRSWMDRTWYRDLDVSKSEIHQLIVELDFPLIYTTNYDSLIEQAYDHHGKKFTKVVNVADLAGRSERTQIVKFHGDLEHDESIVLAESSYFGRLSFESPLDIKMRADILSKTILFVGYGLADINIRYMLYLLDKQWQSAYHQDTRPKAYLFLTRPNIIQEKILESRHITPVVAASDDPGEALTMFLKDLLAAVRKD